MSFTDIYTGSPVNPQDISFRAISLSGNTTLQFPAVGQDASNNIARIMEVTPTGGGFSITLPPANETGVGFDTLIRNAGGSSFSVLDNGGNTLGTIPAGQVYYFYLKNNSTAAGTWASFQFGVGTSTIDAATIAGSGLLASGGLLNLEHDIDAVSSTPYTVLSTDRARMKNWTGGAGVFNLPLASSVGNGYFFISANNGSGTLTVTPTGGNTINGSSSVVLNQGENAFVISNGSNWFTIGQGRQTSTSVTRLVKSVAGGSNVNLNSTEAAFSVLEFTGLITANIDVTVPAAVGRWTVYNNTTGAFTLTFKVLAGSGVAITRGDRVWTYSDGTNMFLIDTSVPSTSVGLSQPSAGITVSGSPVVGSGTMTLALANDLAAVEALSGTGIAKRTGVDTWSVGTVNLSSEVTGILPSASFPALTGDVTTAGGSLSTTISDDSVTYAKMQNVSATDRILGRQSSGSGNVEEIPCTSSARSLLDDADFPTMRITLGVNIPDIILKHSVSASTSGGTASAATWNTGPLNTEERDVLNICTLSSNQFTLPGGTYYIEATSQAVAVAGHKTRIRNVTDGTTAVVGEAAFLATATAVGASAVSLCGSFTISGSKTFELQHYTTSARSTDGLGTASGGSENEVYRTVKIWKVG